MILLDTNILIEILKNNQSTTTKVNSFSPPLAITSITAMELFYGARNKSEVRQLRKFIQLFPVIHIDHEISNHALRLVIEFAQSHKLDIPDSLIAATALVHRARLFTYNVKDFKFIPDLEMV